MKALVVTKFRFIGDTILATPLIRGIKEADPRSEVTLLSGPIGKELMRGCPYVSEVLEFDPYSADRGLRSSWRMARELRKRSFDVGFLLNRSYHSALLAFLGRVKQRVGFASEGRGWLLHKAIHYDRRRPEIECYLDLLRAQYQRDFSGRQELWLLPEEETWAKKKLAEVGVSERDVVVGLQPGANYTKKQWHTEGFASLAERLSKDLGAKILLFGGRNESYAAEEMERICKAPLIDLIGKTTLRECFALLARLSLFVGNDTGIMHAAVALSCPTIALFGATAAAKWGTDTEKNVVIASPNGDMNEISDREVFFEARALLTGERPGGVERPRAPRVRDGRPRIVLFHMNQVGDLLFSLPAVANLRAAYPESQIMSVARADHCKLLLQTGLVDEAVVRPYGTKSQKYRLLKLLRSQKFDLAIMFSGSYESVLYAYLAGVKRRVGFAGSDAAFLLTDRVVKIGPPTSQNDLLLVTHLNVTPATTDYVGLVKCSPFDVENVRDCLLNKGLNTSESYAVLAPAASKYRRHKEWPDEGWEQLARAMLDSGLRPVFVGAAHEGALRARRARGVIDMSGETSLMELAALLQLATVFVGIDSGAMHLAAAMETPVVGLFGPTSPEFTGPLGNKSRVIYHPECCTCRNRSKCHNPSCLRSITVEEVMDEASSLLTMKEMTQVV